MRKQFLSDYTKKTDLFSRAKHKELETDLIRVLIQVRYLLLSHFSCDISIMATWVVCSLAQ